MEVELHKLLEVCADDLVGVDEDDLLEVHGEEHVEEEDLVRPDDPLLLLLCAEPGRPFVCHELVLEVVRFGEVWNEFLTKTVGEY